MKKFITAILFAVLSLSPAFAEFTHRVDSDAGRNTIVDQIAYSGTPVWQVTNAFSATETIRFVQASGFNRTLVLGSGGTYRLGDMSTFHEWSCPNSETPSINTATIVEPTFQNFTDGITVYCIQ
jgi:hypothetical protein